MDQNFISIKPRPDHRPISVSAPHEWDGIGQALRCAYESHRPPPADIAQALDDLDSVD